MHIAEFFLALFVSAIVTASVGLNIYEFTDSVFVRTCFWGLVILIGSALFALFVVIADQVRKDLKEEEQTRTDLKRGLAYLQGHSPARFERIFSKYPKDISALSVDDIVDGLSADEVHSAMTLAHRLIRNYIASQKKRTTT